MVTATSYLHFTGLDHPIALEGASRLEPLLANIFSKWEHTQDGTPRRPPFVTIKAKDREKWSLVLADGSSPPRNWNAVNVICDLVSEMAWERLRSDPKLLCLHAAAIDFGGQLVVLPNGRRAGKSTLVAALTRLGHRVFSDDVLPICYAEATERFVGIANGVAPRLRLPLPETFSDAFHTWVAQDSGPANKQYKYLVDGPIAQGSETMQLRAIIILDRQDDASAPSLQETTDQDLIATLVTQNFARSLHAGTILKSLETLTRHVPAYRLTYHCGEEAAAFLSSHPALQRVPPPIQRQDIPDTRQAPLDMLHQLAIHRLNAGSAAIWHLISEPADLDDVIAILTAAFDDIDARQIANDSERIMTNFVKARLIVPEASPGADK